LGEFEGDWGGGVDEGWEGALELGHFEVGWLWILRRWKVARVFFWEVWRRFGFPTASMRVQIADLRQGVVVVALRQNVKLEVQEILRRGNADPRPFNI
jgi:hypothetical protein